MTRDEAKAILQSCLAPDKEPADERMEEALALVEQDAELASWFEKEMSFDKTMRDMLTELEPPAGLKERILAVGPSSGNTPIPFPIDERPWWQNPKFISLAACIILIFTFGSMLLDPQTLSADPDIPDFYADIANTSKNPPMLEEQSDSLDELRKYLAQRGAPIPGEMPAKVDPLIEVGATTITWREVPVAVVTMKDDQNYQLFVIDLAVFGDDDVPPSQLEIHHVDEVGILAWSENGQLYALSVIGQNERLSDFL